MAQSTIGPNLDEALDVHLDFTAQITLDHVLSFDDVANRADLRLREVLVTLVGIDPSSGQDIVAPLTANAVDVGQGTFNALVSGQSLRPLIRTMLYQPSLNSVN